LDPSKNYEKGTSDKAKTCLFKVNNNVGTREHHKKKREDKGLHNGLRKTAVATAGNRRKSNASGGDLKGSVQASGARGKKKKLWGHAKSQAYRTKKIGDHLPQSSD